MCKYKNLTAANFLFSFLLVAVLSVTSLYSQAASSNSSGKANPATFLTGPNTGKPLAIARKYLEQNKGELGLSSIDIAGVVVTNQYTSSHNGVTHIYFQQHYQGIGVHNASININIAVDGSVINLGNRFMAGIDTAINSTLPLVPRGQAISAAARSLGIPSSGPISSNPIVAKLVYQPVAKNMLRLAWDMDIYELDAKNWWSMRIDAINATVLDRKNYVNQENYQVYPIPVESPSHGSIDNLPMPIGTSSTWVEIQCTSGNNADAYLDTDNSNSPTGGNNARACNSGLDFSFSLDLSKEPNQYQDAAVTNLFYWNNVIHDVFYQYGFDEASGNFQNDNSDNGGLGNDAVNAEAQDGGGTNNANFATPPDGQAPRMQMYLWNYTSPARDGDFDNGIIVHEYGHGISNRLTGGPAAATCLNNTEQAGEGWSDYFSLVMTIEPTDNGVDGRGIGTYALGQPIGGVGIRDFPYSTLMSIDPRTYDAIKTAAVPHGVGSTWAAMLWQMTWALIDEHGFDLDLYNGNGGNNIALQLVVDGLKLQPCSPGFVDARNAILLADQNNNAGVNQCLIWEAFAERGLGFSADQGSAANRSDGIQAFDLPQVCQEVLTIAVSASPEPVESGEKLTYTLQVENNTIASLTSVTVTDSIPEHTSYVASLEDCDGIESGEVLIGTMQSGNSYTCEFKVQVSNSTALAIIYDDVENGSSLWTISHGAGSDNWSLNSDNPYSPFNSWFAEDIATSTDQYLTLLTPISIHGDAILKFWHHYDTEAAWDGGVVEISVNGGAWDDLGSMMIQNGYNSIITSNPASAISDRYAFSGNSGSYIETVVNLSSYASSTDTVQIRFRMATDGLIGGLGWYIDNIEIIDDALITNQACVIADGGGNNDCDSVNTIITGMPVPHIVVSPSSISSNQNENVTTSQTLNIGNSGSAQLTWWAETDNGGDCSQPNEGLAWVDIDPSPSAISPETVPRISSTNVEVSFNSGDNPGVYNGVLCVFSDDSVNSVITVPLTLAVNDPESIVEQLATGETSAKGTVSGSYLDTQIDGVGVEIVTEAHQGGKPANRWDELLHTWTFQLGSGEGITFKANAWVMNDVENEEIGFYYSNDNVTYYHLYTVTSTSNENMITVQLPDQGTGVFYLRAKDNDQTRSNNSNASLYVDHLSITEGGTSLPQPQAIEMKVSLADNSSPSNRRNRWDAIVQTTVVNNATPNNPVVNAVVSGHWSNGASGSGTCTTDSVGQCTIKKPNLKLTIPSVDFTIDDVARGADNYDKTIPAPTITLSIDTSD